jgi:hypothetical protein
MSTLRDRGTWASLFLAAGALCSVVVACGCSSDAEACSAADPASGPPADGCGAFVSASRGDDANGGTRDAPVRTLKRAIAIANGGGRWKNVYACAEAFTEAVELPSGTSLWGGLDCAGDWRPRDEQSRTTLSAGPDQVPLTVRPAAKDVTWIVNLRVEAADASTPGGSSMALVLAYDVSAQVDITAKVLHSEVIAGDGAAPGGSSIAVFDAARSFLVLAGIHLVAGAGADGTAGEDGGLEPANAGLDGERGADACSDTLVAGAPAVGNRCGELRFFGGRGGDGGAEVGHDGSDGDPLPLGENPTGAGLGGKGEGAAGCTDGQPGLAGASAGTAFDPEREMGRVLVTGWKGVDGFDGNDGRPGLGGGGGGGARGGALACGAGPRGGASGGAGGAAGCGGKGGKGGTAGGASIGFMSRWNVFNIEGDIKVGRGGNGGGGGRRQRGGRGGTGGPGGSGRAGSRNGCRGGDGGAGGDGGPGRRGMGGPSTGIMFVNYGPGGVIDVHVDFADSVSGKGGIGGDPLNENYRGQVGDGGVTAYASE